MSRARNEKFNLKHIACTVGKGSGAAVTFNQFVFSDRQVVVQKDMPAGMSVTVEDFCENPVKRNSVPYRMAQKSSVGGLIDWVSVGWNAYTLTDYGHSPPRVWVSGNPEEMVIESE
jgi:hypothetical protein